MTTIGPTPIIIPNIILTVLIWDGAVTRGINTAIMITISIGVTITIGQVIITKTPTMAITETINVVATVNTIETIIGRATMDANCDDKLIIGTGRQMGRAN